MYDWHLKTQLPNPLWRIQTMRILHSWLAKPFALLSLLGLFMVNVSAVKEDSLAKIADYKEWTKVTLTPTLTLNPETITFDAASLGG